MLGSMSMLALLLGVATASESDDAGVQRAFATGLTPTVMAIGSMTATDAVGALDRLAAADWSAISSLESQIASASDELTTLTDQYVRTGDPDLEDEISGLRSSIQSDRAALDAALVSVLTTVLAPMEGFGIDIECARGMETSGLPPEFCVLDLEQPAHADLQLAITAERRAARRGETPPEWATEVLAIHRSNPDVVAAKAHSETHLAAIEAVFDAR